MFDPRHDPSIQHEPHLRSGGFEVDPSEAKAAGSLRPDRADDAVEHSVWDEPALAGQPGTVPPADGASYAAWLERHRQATTSARQWQVTLAVALAAGPWAIFGALASGGQTSFKVLVVVVFAPLIEEIMKVAAASWVVERRPYLFGSRLQIAFAALCGGLVFAALENVLYLRVRIENPSELLIAWRWTVCVAMHAMCSLIAGLGLMRIWRTTMQHRTRPELALGAPFFIAAMVVHGTYNAAALVLEQVVPF